MKIIFITIIATISLNSFASVKCEHKVFDQFIEMTQNYEFHNISSKYKIHPAGKKGFESWGKYIELGYEFDVASYSGSNEYWSGYGAYEIIVDISDCRILKMVEVYTE